MPTGYTYGIINGDIKSFEEFAQQCTKGFLYHLRDTTGYVRAVPSAHYKDAGREARKELVALVDLTYKEILDAESARIKNSIKDLKKIIVKKRKQKVILEIFLQKAKAYIPPTEGHVEIAKFMVNQLEITIESDCSIDYYMETVAELRRQLDNINVISLRESLIKDKENQINRYKMRYLKEVEDVRAINKWYDDFMESINR